jgi:hypothetical protein
MAGHALTKTSRGRYAFRGEAFVGGNLRRATVAVCPRCITDDIAAAPQVQPQLAAFGRAIWQFDAIKTCPLHTVSLVMIAEEVDIRMRHDFAHYIVAAVPRLAFLVGQAERRQLTALERYVIVRLDGGRTSPFVDGLELHAAIKFAEILGAVELFGRAANLRQLSDDHWRSAGAAGFEIATGGYPSIEVLLRKLQRTFDYSRSGNEGAKSIFGQLYQRLEARAAGPAYDQLRDVVGKYIRGHLPLGPGDLVFGQPVEKRTLHSIRSLSLETGLYPKLLRKMLRTAGMISVEHDTLLDANAVFPSDEAIRAVKQTQRSLTRAKMGRYLNVPSIYRNGLIQAGLLTPRSSDNRFAIVDLDNFLARLFDGAQTVVKASASQVGIPAAAKRAFCSGAAIVRLIIDKKLKWVGRLAGTEGYLSILVDIEEIREQVRGEDHGGLPRQPDHVAR